MKIEQDEYSMRHMSVHFCTRVSLYYMSVYGCTEINVNVVENGYFAL